MYTACNFISELEWRCLEWQLVKCALREKCPNTEFFMVRILPHSDWIRRVTEYLSVFSPNARKYGPEKTPYLDSFHAVELFWDHLFGSYAKTPYKPTFLVTFSEKLSLVLNKWSPSYRHCNRTLKCLKKSYVDGHGSSINNNFSGKPTFPIP